LAFGIGCKSSATRGLACTLVPLLQADSPKAPTPRSATLRDTIITHPNVCIFTTATASVKQRKGVISGEWGIGSFSRAGRAQPRPKVSKRKGPRDLRRPNQITIEKVD